MLKNIKVHFVKAKVKDATHLWWIVLKIEALLNFWAFGHLGSQSVGQQGNPEVQQIPTLIIM